MKKRVLIVILLVLSAFIAIVGIFAVISSVFVISFAPRQYVTTDLADYGQYTGNHNDRYPQEFVTSFFPAEIENSFSDVTYSYRAQKGDTYAFEAYLEFTIEDPAEYERFVSEYTAGMTGATFQYDTAFTEYLLEDQFWAVTPDGSIDGEDEKIHISYAEIGKILCSPTERRIIFVALGVYDGGLATADFLGVYFGRFHIDPIEYGSTRCDPKWAEAQNQKTT